MARVATQCISCNGSFPANCSCHLSNGSFVRAFDGLDLSIALKHVYHMGLESKGQLNWYVLRAIGGRERKVCQYIENEVARLHYEEYVPNVLVPMEKVLQMRSDGKKKVSRERVYYPGYVFVEALLEGEIPHFLSNAPDVLGFLNAPNGDPAPLQPSEVNRLLGNADDLTMKEEALVENYNVGDVVRVVDGPFNTFSGVISEVNEEKRKLTVMVKIFERKTPLELNYMQVEKE